MRKLSLLALLIFPVFLSGCSFSTTLALINLSDKPVQVRYRFQDSPGSFQPVKPATKAYAELDNNDSAWTELPTEQYIMDSHSRTIIVTVAPQTALRVDRLHNRTPLGSEPIPINEIVVRGANGTIMLFGDQVRKSFIEETKSVYSITYK